MNYENDQLMGVLNDLTGAMKAVLYRLIRLEEQLIEEEKLRDELFRQRTTVPLLRRKARRARKKIRSKVMPKKKSKAQRKVATVMREFKHGELKSGGGGKVKNKRQAVAIALSKAGKSKKKRKK